MTGVKQSMRTVDDITGIKSSNFRNLKRMHIFFRIIHIRNRIDTDNQRRLAIKMISDKYVTVLGTMSLIFLRKKRGNKDGKNQIIRRIKVI